MILIINFYWDLIGTAKQIGYKHAPTHAFVRAADWLSEAVGSGSRAKVVKSKAE